MLVMDSLEFTLCQFQTKLIQVKYFENKLKNNYLLN